jgi:succinate dehydrogenase / fumarate reductase, iron-sulfur subunit
MDSTSNHFSVKVFRTDPKDASKTRFDTFLVPYEKGQSILGVLKYIYETFDSSLAFYDSCRIGKCTGCHLKVNGKTRLSCTTVTNGGDLVLEPIPGYPIIRDLVVDRTQQTIASRKDKRQVTEE